MTMTSTGPRALSSFRPSCSCTAVKRFGPSGSAAGGGAAGGLRRPERSFRFPAAASTSA